MSETPRPVEELRPDTPARARAAHRALPREGSREAPRERRRAAPELAATTSSAGAVDALPRAQPLPARDGDLRRRVHRRRDRRAAARATRRGSPSGSFTGALIVMALGFPVVLFTGYTQYVARKVAQATPTLTPRGTLVRPSANGTHGAARGEGEPARVVGAHGARRRRRAHAFALLVAGYLVLRVLGIGPSGSLLGAGKLTAQDKVLVATFDAASRDSALGDVVAVAVRTNLAQSRAVHARADERHRRRARAHAEAGDVTRRPRARARDRAARGDQGGRRRGTSRARATGYIITARLVSARVGRRARRVSGESAASAGDIIPAVDRLTKQLRGKIGESLKSVTDAPALAQVTTSSLDALASYAAGMRANDVEGDFAKAVPLFEEAIAKDTRLRRGVRPARDHPRQRRTAARAAGLARLDRRIGCAPAARARALRRGGCVLLQHERPARRRSPRIERALAIDSSDVDALNSLAILSMQTRNTARAVQLTGARVADEPESGILYDQPRRSHLINARQVRRGRLRLSRDEGAEDRVPDRA